MVTLPLSIPIDVERLLQSDVMEDAFTLKDASISFAAEFRKRDKLCNSPVRSKFLSQNYLDNYIMIEGVCKNMRITDKLKHIAFCGIRLSVDSMRVLSESFLTNTVLKKITFNYCLLDLSLIEAIMPGLCQSKSIETVDFSCNGLDDKASYLIAKIVSA